MVKRTHEIRDPIHTFVRLDTDERRVVDSRPFQRLRHIHQLALTYLVYPGATHRRFEHSLGVMELAGRVFEVVTEQANIHPGVRDVIVPKGTAAHSYWHRAVRMAALCHDVGHLPFSHAAEKELLPKDWDHEQLTIDLIRGDEMQKIWSEMKPPLSTEDIVKIAVGQKKLKDTKFTDWEAILSEIVVGDAFGVDRMDYLLRDAYHAGVAYGSFDRHRLIDTLRILPRQETDSSEPALGLEAGGIHSSEALLLARYFMYQQVYLHPVRRIYDIHLKDFLKSWLPDGFFSTDIEQHLNLTDVEATAAILAASRNSTLAGHDAARHIVARTHFKVLYQRNPGDLAINLDSAKAVYTAACQKFGEANIRFNTYRQKGGPPDFPVLTSDGRIDSSLNLSEVLKQIPVAAVDYVFVDRSRHSEASAWLTKERGEIISSKTGRATQ